MMESKRPLSPHLQVYKPQLTSILSITHRASGIALSTGTFFVVGWLVALAGGERYFDVAHYLASQWYGLIILAGYTWALSYHLCNGIRHLFWDAGYGFELTTVYRSGWATLVGSIFLTSAAWATGLLV